jgi:hypothetical protein
MTHAVVLLRVRSCVVGIQNVFAAQNDALK